jgi:hypothetical protein
MRFKASFSDTTARSGRAILSSVIGSSLFMMTCEFFLDTESLSMQSWLAFLRLCRLMCGKALPFRDRPAWEEAEPPATLEAQPPHIEKR